MIKKIILGVLALIVIGVGGLFLVNGKDNYDASKFSVKTTNGINVGSTIEFTLPDQFNKSHSLTNDTKRVIFVFAKSTGHTVREYLKKQSKDYLPKRSTLFVANISGMPTVIRNTFALPDFKKSPYSVLLIYDKKLAKQFESDKNRDKITIVTLKNKTIKDVKYITTENELKDILQ